MIDYIRFSELTGISRININLRPKLFSVYIQTINELISENTGTAIMAPINKTPEIFPETNYQSFAERFRCSVCFDNAVNLRLDPCGHLLCSSCYSKLRNEPIKKCPICRENINNTNYIFYGGCDYKKKYLKYKLKYLNLKSKNNS